jgi:FKBP-type peptidyl-prolyl cis-trans isomerase (trigger factor)
MRALAAYAKKQGVEGSEGYKSMRKEMERFVLRGLMADKVSAKNVEVTDKEVEAAYAEHSAEMVRDGKKIPLGMVKEYIRAALRSEKGEKIFDAYVTDLRKKAKITVNDAVLPKV